MIVSPGASEDSFRLATLASVSESASHRFVASSIRACSTGASSSSLGALNSAGCEAGLGAWMAAKESLSAANRWVFNQSASCLFVCWGNSYHRIRLNFCPAVSMKLCGLPQFPRSADLEVGDTAGLAASVTNFLRSLQVFEATQCATRAAIRVGQYGLNRKVKASSIARVFSLSVRAGWLCQSKA